MKYERLNCYCLLEIEIQFVKKNIYILKLSSLPFFLSVVCFIFKTAMIMYITREQRIWQVVGVPS